MSGTDRRIGDEHALIYQILTNGEVRSAVPVARRAKGSASLRRPMRNRSGLAAHIFVGAEDWSGPVTDNNPAKAGEIVHFYGAGFGPVHSHPPDGYPAPVSPLLPTTSPVQCTAYEVGPATPGTRSSVEMPVLFAGLAPGLVGYYQIDAMLPSVRQPVAFRCAVGLHS